MGCTSSISTSCELGRRTRRRKKSAAIPKIVVSVPSLWVPTAADLLHPLRGLVSRDVLDNLSALRSRILLLAEQNILLLSVVLELQQALQEYLPVLLGLTKKESRLESLVEFRWRSFEDDGRVTSLASAWYEVLSVLHMLAMLSLLEANMMLVPKSSLDECEGNVLEDSKKNAIDLLLRASGYLDYCVHHILVCLPLQIKQRLPYELQEGVLEAISMQALGQGVEMQLGLAGEQKATLPVKRRLACEEVSYFGQAHFCLSGCDTSNIIAKKQLLFIKWKYLEAKAAAYYYNGLLLDKSNVPSNHINAVYCLLAADELLMDSKRACLSFCLAVPVTRVPPVWGVMKHLHKKIPEVASKKCQMYGYLFDEDKTFPCLPDLPEFPLSLKPDDLELPDIDASWDSENCRPQAQSLKEHLQDEDEDFETA